MEINEIPRGQLSTIILTTLLERDRYGLEIIEEIEKQTIGEVVIKKPSLYSSLSRMEKQDLVSSYWKDSELGGKRHYYRLTDYGKKQVLQWQNDLIQSQSKVSKILNKSSEKKENEISEKKDTILQQENLFHLSNQEIKKQEKQEQIVQEKKLNETNDFIQYDLFSANNFISHPAEETEITKKMPISSEPIVFNVKSFEKNEEKSEPKINEKQINKEQKPLQKIITNFNFENEYAKYVKSSSSFAQTISNNEEKIVDVGNKMIEGLITSNIDMIKSPQHSPIEKLLDEKETELPKETSKVDDAILITEKPDEKVLPKVKKIAPASFNHDNNNVTKKFEPENLNIQAKNKVQFQNEKIKDYFASKNILYNSYSKMLKKEVEIEKETVKQKVNPSKIHLIESASLFLIYLIESLVVIFVLNKNQLFDFGSLWLYILFAVLFAGIFTYRIIKYIKNKQNAQSNFDSVRYSIWYKIIIVALLLILIYAIHMLAGLNQYNFVNYLTTLLLALFLAFDYLAFNIAQSFYLK